MSQAPNRNGYRLLDYIRRYQLTRWGTSGVTHSLGGTLDHIPTSGPVASRVTYSSVPVLFSDHVALLPATPFRTFATVLTFLPNTH